MAIISIKKKLLDSDQFGSFAQENYHNSIETVVERYESIYQRHFENFGEIGSFFSVPGRIEVIGNHTDHNNGKVICAAISVDLLAAVSPLEGKIIIDSEGFPKVEVDINQLNIRESENGKSEALVRGVLKGFFDRGFNIGGFCATTTSSVFKGAGMSSSAAFELLVCEVLDEFYNQGQISAIEKAIVSQYAENVYFGKPSGLMDQSAIALGGISYIDFENLENPSVEKMNWPFKDISVVVVNCGQDHANLTSEYSSIRTEMEEVARALGQSKLRFITREDFYLNIPKLHKNKKTGRALLRAEHFFEENERVEKLRESIQQHDIGSFLQLVNESGLSSYTKLQNVYQAGDTIQSIPLALSLSQRFGALASRVHGGGFAGTILAFIERDKEEVFVRKMAEVFEDENIYVLKIRNLGAVKVNF